MTEAKKGIRNYKGPCRKCKAPEMVICKPDCTYVDPWEDYYLGPTDKNRREAKTLLSQEMGEGLHPVLRVVSR